MKKTFLTLLLLSCSPFLIGSEEGSGSTDNNSNDDDCYSWYDSGTAPCSTEEPPADYNKDDDKSDDK